MKLISNRRTALAKLPTLFGFTSVYGQAREEIRDARRGPIGTLSPGTGGTIEARNASARMVGTYNPSTRETRDHQGRLVSYGNTLAALLMCSGQPGPPR